MKSFTLLSIVLLLAVCAFSAAADTPLPSFDFLKVETPLWAATNDVSAVTQTREGMQITISGGDPYLYGPAADYPEGQPLWLILRLRSSQGGTGQVFYFSDKDGPSEAHSVRFSALENQWETLRIPLPPLGSAFRLRLDPPGTGGICTVDSLRFELRNTVHAPIWPRPLKQDVSPEAPQIKTGELMFRHSETQYGAFELWVRGIIMTRGNTQTLIGYQRDNGKIDWLDMARSGRTLASAHGDELKVETQFQDADNVDWTIKQRFHCEEESVISIEVEVVVSRDRRAVWLPLLTLLPGHEVYGIAKTQALFPGLEYLDYDASSSEDDLIGPQAQRQIPDSEKITIPMMAISVTGRFFAVGWAPDSNISALFDSPDRQFKSNAHLMALLYPGAGAGIRAEGSLMPYEGSVISAAKSIHLKAEFFGGLGSTVVPALKAWIARNGLPPLPETGLAPRKIYRLAAAGYLDSRLGDGNGLYRHAYPGSFTPGPAADASVFMEWLADHVENEELHTRLQKAAELARSQAPEEDPNGHTISHVFYPVASLVWSHALTGAAKIRQNGEALIGQFEPDGTLLYKPKSGGVDYSRTYPQKNANGLAAPVVASVLEAALVSGDTRLRGEGLRLLHALDRYKESIPRGAQTWEIPLHTPDILASAHLVRAYTLGYELTGDRKLLEQAENWAWTGLPFVYLTPPSPEPIGLFSTIAVYGATNWTAPNWMGLPVQWCGLVYADALYRLSHYSNGDFWERVAKGITNSGIQQTWPIEKSSERQGLLPDSFSPTSQIRNDVAINPGTLLANEIHALDESLYDYRWSPELGVGLMAPGEIKEFNVRGKTLTTSIQLWPKHSCQLLLSGLKPGYRLKINGAEPAADHLHADAAQGLLAIDLEGKASLSLTLP